MSIGQFYDRECNRACFASRVGWLVDISNQEEVLPSRKQRRGNLPRRRQHPGRPRRDPNRHIARPPAERCRSLARINIIENMMGTVRPVCHNSVHREGGGSNAGGLQRGTGWISAAILAALFRGNPMTDISFEQIAPALYRGVLEREPDPAGLAHAIEALRSGRPLEELIRTFIASPEFRIRVLQLLPEQIAPALYHGVLEREPDPAGLAHAIEALRSGRPLEELIRDFIASPEFRTRVLQLLPDTLSEEIAPALYHGVLEREPDPAGLAHAIEALRSGRPLEELIRGFIASPEFRTRVLQLLPDSLSEQIAPALYRGILEREPDPAGLAVAVEALRSGQPLEELIRTFIASPEFRIRVLQLIPEQIAPALYRGILGREPDSSGLAHAIEALRSGQPLEELIRGFIASPEFRACVLQLLIPSVLLPDLAAVEAAYRFALAERPDDADIHLQLGHVRKLQDRHAAALDSYGHAARLAPSSITPQRELFQMGQRRNQEYLFEGQLRLGGVEALMAMTQQVLDLRTTLRRLVDALPDILAQMAFPIGCYDRFRAMYDIPIPPSVPTPLTFAILLLADREPVETFLSQLTAFSSQTYESWTLYLIGCDPTRRRIAERAAASDVRIQWADTMRQESTAAAERRVAVSTTADWIVLLSERALLHPRAIAWFASAVGRGSAIAFVTDEETCVREPGGVRRSSPELRQVVDYDTLLEMNTFGETVAVERAAFAAVVDKLTTSSVSAARSALLLALAHNNRVGHIPCPLVCRDGPVTVDLVRAAAAHEEAVLAHVAEGDLAGRIDIGTQTSPLPRLPVLWRPRDPQASITVIIPTRDNGSDVVRLVDSLRRKAGFPDGLRIVIVDNGSEEAETRCVLEDIAKKTWARVLVLDEPFNWSRLNNRAVETLEGSLLVFANDDMVMLSDRWDERLRGLLERSEIGAVGARLLYGDDTLQHAGILFGWKGSTIHDGLYESSLEPGPANRWQVTRAVSAVTGAFLATRRDSFLAHRGFDEVGLPVTYSDIDYALKLRASGLKVLWTPDITLYHFASKTRGLDYLDLEKRARAAAERTVMEARWGPATLADPSVSPVWHMATLPFRLLSAPSQSRLWAHIERCAASNPWLPETTTWPPPVDGSARIGP
jgi:GT2 family glycosyltransferase